ncbi:protein kinase domain-containing protein [Nonomuraea cavernae]|uniref:protein kinase domain-containing protein n=1 Tax=Nonomuraea cavernae TaxID=2045107 RepID=UPI0033D24394
MDPFDPEELDGYTLLERIGEGPRGVVYRGRRGEDGDVVAVKLLAEAPDAGDVARRLRSAMRVSSSYVARVLDAGVWEGRPYLVREFIEGRSLAELVEAEGPLAGDTLERVAVSILTALTPVHLADIAHCGLTPHNLIMSEDGLRLTDVAIGDPAGEIGYRSPEQLNSEPYGPYTDVYSWAAVVTFAATGRPPSGHGAQAVKDAEPQLGTMAEPLRGIVLSALSKDVGQRPTTYSALLGLMGDKNAAVPMPPPGQASLPPDDDEPLWGLPVPPRGRPGLPPGDEPMLGLPVPPPGRAGLPPEDEPLQGLPVPPPPSWVPRQTDGSTKWGPSPSATEPEQTWWQPRTVQAASAAPNRKFPVGLVAAMAAVVLVSAVGLWGASQYAPKQSLQPAAAAGDQTPPPGSVADEQDSADTPAVPLKQEQPAEEPEVKASRVKTPEPQATGVLPFDMPRDDPSSIAMPELSTVPSPLPTQPIATQAIGQPTVTVTASPTQEPTDRRRDGRSPEPHPTQPPAPNPSHSPQPQVTVTVTATPTAEAPTPTEQPTTSTAPTTPAPEPTATQTFTTNPYTPVQVCGDGFVVQRSTQFTSGVTYQLYNGGTGEHCVVTLKNSDIGRTGPVSATLEVRDGPRQSYNGDHEFYAGPVKLRAEDDCVRYTGAVGSFSTTSTWGGDCRGRAR